MIHFLPSYDTEAPGCLEGVKNIVKVHERLQAPATFFIVARLLEEKKSEYQALLKDNPLFEIACHTYTHMPLVDTPRFGKAGTPDRYHRELVESKKLLEDTFETPVVGFRTPVGAPDGLRGKKEALSVLHQAGYTYVSSAAWGPDFSLPAPLRSPFTYAEEGFPELWEIPVCGWHENLLKGHNVRQPILLLLFPVQMPEAVPQDYVKTPEEEFRYNSKPFIDLAVREQVPEVNFAWHPWSLTILDPNMRMVEMTINYARENELRLSTFSELRAALQARPNG